ncbi:hypothetical protein FOL47_006665 [Perkinsus chesapeaki]|uniref:Uncharacterized protein n=1 Tax=Perkinsus chesapeaki TaxID=330153 RepID=A0A7J6LQ75_PERCH|nr:hypothetical protein FOL47_006665 [Perkinsus chesapeaki]
MSDIQSANASLKSSLVELAQTLDGAVEQMSIITARRKQAHETEKLAVMDLRSELMSLKTVLDEQKKVLRREAEAVSEKGALSWEIQTARQKQHELRSAARGLDAEIRTKHRICADMMLKLRGSRNQRSPVGKLPDGEHGAPKDHSQPCPDDLVFMDSQVRRLRDTHDRVKRQIRQERIHGNKRLQNLNHSLSQQKTELENKDELARLAQERYLELQQFVDSNVSVEHDS